MMNPMAYKINYRAENIRARSVKLFPFQQNINLEIEFYILFPTYRDNHYSEAFL